MKKLISLLGLMALWSTVQAQPQPDTPPWTIGQYTFTDSTGHSVPFAIAFSLKQPYSLVLDPSTSPTDQSHVWAHVQGAGALPFPAPTALTVASGYVNMAVQIQETRTVVPFSVTASTVLQTIPFTVATNLQKNGHYRFVARLYVITGSGGSKIDVGGTCNTSNFIAEYQCFAATTLLYGGRLTSFLSGPSGSATGTATLILISGELDVTNGGTFVIQFAQSSSDATPSTVLAGSTLTVTQIP